MDLRFAAMGETREMRPVVRDEVLLIGEEAIRNVGQRSKASQLEILIVHGHDLSVRMRDNGVAIDSAIMERGRPRWLDKTG